ncbi:MAG: phytanoyl-CoA dioxygenase family protein [Gammaproteobacteria bacterium]
MPRLRDLAHDVRLFEIAGAFLRAAPQPYRVTLFEKSPRANWLVVWHQDTALPLCWRFDRPGWGPWSNKAGICYAHAPAAALSRIIALRIHLDDSLASNGPLRVIPGSHRLGIVDDAQIASIVHRSTAVECTIPKGGVVAMRPLIIHASSKTQSDVARRVLHIEYADALDLAPGIRLARA